MGQDPQHALTFAGFVLARAQGGPQASFVLGDRGFNVPAMPVHASMEPLLHLTAVTRLRPLTGVAFVQSNHGGSNAQFPASQPVVVLAIIAGIAQQAVDGQVANRLPDRIGELRRVLAGPVADHQRREQIGVGVTDQRELGPTRAKKPFVADAMNIMSGGVMTFQAGGIDGRFGLILDQATRLGDTENGGEEGIESPFFSSRLWA